METLENKSEHLKNFNVIQKGFGPIVSGQATVL